MGWSGHHGLLSFDPTDSLSNAASTHQPGKYSGVPCEVVLVRRLETAWYTVQFYTDERWGDVITSPSAPSQTDWRNIALHLQSGWRRSFISSGRLDNFGTLTNDPFGAFNNRGTFVNMQTVWRYIRAVLEGTLAKTAPIGATKNTSNRIERLLTY